MPQSLYDKLEHEIVPCFYDRDPAGVPRSWLSSMRQSMATLASTWHSHRMVQQYVESFYLPGVERARWLEEGGGARARDLEAGLERLRSEWPEVIVSPPVVTAQPSGELKAEIRCASVRSRRPMLRPNCGSRPPTATSSPNRPGSSGWRDGVAYYDAAVLADAAMPTPVVGSCAAPAPAAA